MSNVIDYAVAFSDGSPTSYLNGTFSIDVDTFTVTDANITITDGVTSFTFGLSDASLWTEGGANEFQLQLMSLNTGGESTYASAFIYYVDFAPYGNPVISFADGVSGFKYSDGSVHFDQTGSQGSVVQGSDIPSPYFTLGSVISATYRK